MPKMNQPYKEKVEDILTVGGRIILCFYNCIIKNISIKSFFSFVFRIKTPNPDKRDKYLKNIFCQKNAENIL